MREDVVALEAQEEIPEAKAFRLAAEAFILSRYSFGWGLVAETAKGRRPVGSLFGVFAGPYLMIGDVQWYPWASDRNKLETIAKFLSDADIPMMWLATDKDKDFYVVLARHGLVRRIGTGYGAGRQAFFEVRLDGNDSRRAGE